CGFCSIALLMICSRADFFLVSDVINEMFSPVKLMGRKWRTPSDVRHSCHFVAHANDRLI
ncbi:MAG: hypothetical protein WA124_11285, partial [Smithella sp.]